MPNDKHIKVDLDFLNKTSPKRSTSKSADQFRPVKKSRKNWKNILIACGLGVLFLGWVMFSEDHTSAPRANVPNESQTKGSLAQTYNEKAYAIYQSGENLDQGLELINKAIELEPTNGFIFGTKAELLYKMKDFDGAYKYIKMALALEPGHEEMKQDLKRIEEALGLKISSTNDDTLVVGNYRCSADHNNQLALLVPDETEQQLSIEQSLFEQRKIEIDDLASKIASSTTNEYSSQDEIDQFNELVNEHNAKLESFRQDASVVSDRIDKYNAQVDALNAYLAQNCTMQQ